MVQYNHFCPVLLLMQITEASTRQSWNPIGLVRMRSAVQIRPAAPKNPRGLRLSGIFAAKKLSCGVAENSAPRGDPRRHKLQIPRFTLAGKARSFHCASVSKGDPLRWARVWSKEGRAGRSAFPPGFCRRSLLCGLSQDAARGLGGLRVSAGMPRRKDFHTQLPGPLCARRAVGGG